jgi:flavin-dependent dehydrogenase
MATDYDAIVVGARCAGSPTAMLLARAGYRVLLVDRAEFPSDTLSTHVIHVPGVAALNRWALLDRVAATGCPRMEGYSFDFGPVTISGTPRPRDGLTIGYAPRRTVLDKILVDAAAEAGAEVREHFNVDEILIEDGTVVGIRGHADGGAPVVERARVVIGADGRNSHVAKAVGAEEYNEKPRLQWSYYTYWSGLPVNGFEIVARPGRGWGAVQTNDGLTMLVIGWPYAEANAFKADVEANYLETLELAPEFAERVRDAKREEPFSGGAVPNFFRKPFGPGWALVGDAGYNKDRAGNQRRVPRRGTLRDGRGRGAPRRPVLRRRHVGVPGDEGRGRAVDIRVHRGDGNLAATAAEDAAVARRPPRQSGCGGRVREHHRRYRLAG